MNKQLQQTINKILNESEEVKPFDVSPLEKEVSKIVGVPVTFKFDITKLISNDLTKSLKVKIFKKLYIVGNSHVSKDGEKITFSLDYKWEHFDYGTNGTGIGVFDVEIATGKILASRITLK